MSAPTLAPGAASRSPFLLGLRCTQCGREYDAAEVRYVCSCGPKEHGAFSTLDAVFDYPALRPWAHSLRHVPIETAGIGAFAPLLPIRDADSLPPLPVGGTPLLAATRLGRSLGLARLLIKDDGRNPSGSLKDRASAVAVAHARERGQSTIAVASTGNAAASLSSQGAATGVETVVFIPKSAPIAKLAQVIAHGSTVFIVDGSYDDAYALCLSACEERGWYNRCTGFNPFMTEGKKTVALEIAYQLGRGSERAFAVPDAVFVAVGDGCILGGVHKGFCDLYALGLIDRMPRLFGVQSEQSAALYDAWRDGAPFPSPVLSTTRADSISVNLPKDAFKALRAVRETGGRFVSVTDRAILDAILTLAKTQGLFTEPAAAAALAGLKESLLHGWVAPEETLVLICTGSGLKDAQAVMGIAQAPTGISARSR